MQIDIGLAPTTRAHLSDGLGTLLADTFTLYLETHRFHWNVEGPFFSSLHALFEQQYTELWAAIDEIAERIRALGDRAPGSFADFSARATLAQIDGHPDADTMVRRLVDGHEALARSLRALLPEASEAGDESTAGLLADRLRIHEKTAWMLRASLPR